MLSLGQILKKRNEHKSHLTERLEPATSKELKKFKKQFENDPELKDLVFVKKLKYTKYKYLIPDIWVLHLTLYQAMEYIINKKIGVSYFLKDNSDVFLAFIFYLEDDVDPKIIEAVKVFNFKEKENKPDDIAFDKDSDVKDTVKIMNSLREKYDEIHLEAYNKKAAAIYEMYRKHNKGFVDEKNGILYYVIPGRKARAD
jgi:hypothetical protein